MMPLHIALMVGLMAFCHFRSQIVVAIRHEVSSDELGSTQECKLCCRCQKDVTDGVVNGVMIVLDCPPQDIGQKCLDAITPHEDEGVSRTYKLFEVEFDACQHEGAGDRQDACERQLQMTESDVEPEYDETTRKAAVNEIKGLITPLVHICSHPEQADQFIDRVRHTGAVISDAAQELLDSPDDIVVIIADMIATLAEPIKSTITKVFDGRMGTEPQQVQQDILNAVEKCTRSQCEIEIVEDTFNQKTKKVGLDIRDVKQLADSNLGRLKGYFFEIAQTRPAAEIENYIKTMFATLKEHSRSAKDAHAPAFGAVMGILGQGRLPLPVISPCHRSWCMLSEWVWRMHPSVDEVADILAEMRTEYGSEVWWTEVWDAVSKALEKSSVSREMIEALATVGLM